MPAQQIRSSSPFDVTGQISSPQAISISSRVSSPQVFSLSSQVSSPRAISISSGASQARHQLSMAANYRTATGELGFESRAPSLLPTQTFQASQSGFSLPTNLELVQLRDQCAHLHEECQGLRNQNAELRGELSGLKQVPFFSHPHANVIE